MPKCIVLDTNVCLDLFVFRDPRWFCLYTALKKGAVRAVTRGDCRNEWLYVLSYPHLPLDEESKIAAMAEFDALISCIEAKQEAYETSDLPGLPICSDADDQKFLELARDSQAQALITKDKALLKLGRKTAKAGLFSIIPPQAWTVFSQGNK